MGERDEGSLPAYSWCCHHIPVPKGMVGIDQFRLREVWKNPIRFEAVPTVTKDVEVINKPNPTGEA